MAILKISFVLMVMSCLSVTNTEDVRPEENNEADTLDMTFNKLNASMALLFQRCYKDRGDIASRNLTREELLTKDSEFIDNYSSILKKELECGFVFSALAHVYLTNVNSLEQEKLTFTEETAYMIHYALKYERPKLLDVMWLVYLYNSQIDELIKSFGIGRDHVDYKNTLLTSKAALEKVLEEFTESYECKVYDWQTCEVQDIKYLVMIKDALEGRMTGIPLTLKFIKARFSIQRSLNSTIFKNKETLGIGLDQLRLSHLMKDTYAIDNLIKTFGVQVDSGPIVEHFLKRYQDTYNTNVPLPEYINSFITLQSHVITTFKAIALRIVILYLMNIKQTLASCSMMKSMYYLVRFYRKYNQKMITLLTDLASFIGQPDDQYLQKVIQILNKYFFSYFIVSWFDYHINSVLSLLEDMTSKTVLSTFSNPLMDNDFGKMVDFNEIVKKYSVILNENFDSAQQIIAVTIIYIKQIKKINEGVNFRAYNSIVCLNESDHYKRLVDLETANENKNII